MKHSDIAVWDNSTGQQGNQVVIAYRGDEYDQRHLRLMGDLGQIIPTVRIPADSFLHFRWMLTWTCWLGTGRNSI
jgi:hypothetical protein